jgi:hypothetical protein
MLLDSKRPSFKPHSNRLEWSNNPNCHPSIVFLEETSRNRNPIAKFWRKENVKAGPSSERGAMKETCVSIYTHTSKLTMLTRKIGCTYSCPEGNRMHILIINTNPVKLALDLVSFQNSLQTKAGSRRIWNTSLTIHLYKEIKAPLQEITRSLSRRVLFSRKQLTPQS